MTGQVELENQGLASFTLLWTIGGLGLHERQFLISIFSG